MKQIQEWLGHSDISTTANIYAHLDSQSKQLSAATIGAGTAAARRATGKPVVILHWFRARAPDAGR